VRTRLVGKRDEIDRVRGVKRRALGTVRPFAADLHQRVDYLESQQSKVERQIRAASQRSSGASLPAGPIRGGSTFIWPVDGPITSPFCESRAWERCHPGIDIGVPSGTPIRAAGAGKVILAGPVSGYGNYTCVQHSDPLSTCYAHQSQIQVGVGQPVSQGQVIGISGCTGLCFGAHLHFEARVNGSVVNPLSYLA
jgi:murein DD-endopeptidase MepM/ murein hydrolase activator NlpD